MTAHTIRGQEQTEIHTRMLRIGLAEADSRIYWAHAGGLAAEELVTAAFEERWFGSRTMARVRYLINNFTYRFNTFPGCLEVLNRWDPTDLADRTLLCHWHVQMSDPLYREFTSSVFSLRRQRPEPTIDRSSTLRWVESITENRWSSSTSQRMATGLMACATEAGLCSSSKTIRALTYPKVSDHALGYLLYLLKDLRYEGNLKDNPYALSVGLEGEQWSQRIRKLPWITYRRMADLHDLKWEFESLEEWARKVFPG